MKPSLDEAALGGWRVLFLVAGLYDLLLGLAFLVAGEQVLSTIGMTPPPHPAYFQLSAVFVAVQGISYLVVWRDPRANLGLVWVGVLYKAAYTGLAVWYLLTNNMPAAFFVPWAVADAAFMVAFLLFLRAVGRQPVR